MMTCEVVRGTVVARHDGGRGVVTRVTRSRWRRRLLRFWVLWDGAQGEAEYLPGDEKFFLPGLAGRQ